MITEKLFQCTNDKQLLRFVEGLEQQAATHPDAATLQAVTKTASDILTFLGAADSSLLTEQQWHKLRRQLHLTDKNILLKIQDSCERILTLHPHANKEIVTSQSLSLLEQLPFELQKNILDMLSDKEMMVLGKTNKNFKKLCNDVLLQRNKRFHLFSVKGSSYLDVFRRDLEELFPCHIILYVLKSGDCFAAARRGLNYKEEELKDTVTLPVEIRSDIQHGFRMKMLNNSEKIENLYEGKKALEDSKRSDYKQIQIACYEKARQE